MRNFIDRAKRLGISFEGDIDRAAEQYDLLKDISLERELLEDACLPTKAHDIVLRELREKFAATSGKLK